MPVNTLEEMNFLSTLQTFTIHCVATQCASKVRSYCVSLLTAAQNLPELYIGHKVQIALALDSASQRNETRHVLNDHLDVISHLIYICRPNFSLEEEKKCLIWTGIDLLSLLNQCENRFKEQSSKSTLWIEVLNSTSLVSTNVNYLNPISFNFVQHDTDIEQLFQWLHQKEIQIHGRLNRTYGGVPLFWCTQASSDSQSKYGSIRLIFPFSLVYSSNEHHVFDFGHRKNGLDVWHSVLVTKRNQIAGYGVEFSEISLLPSTSLDIAIDLTDGPLILSGGRITFVNHTQRCIPRLPERHTSQHSCYHTCESAMESFVHHLRKSGKLKLDELKHLFDREVFEQLEIINTTLSSQEIDVYQD